MKRAYDPPTLTTLRFTAGCLIADDESTPFAFEADNAALVMAAFAALRVAQRETK